MHSPRIVSVLLVASAALLAGCGGSSSSPPSSSVGEAPSTPAPAAPSGVSPNAPPRAQYGAFANAVNLRPADLPGFTPNPKGAKQSKTGNAAFENESQYNACFAVQKTLKPVFKADSDAFKSGQVLRFEQASSTTRVMSSVAATRAEIARTRRAIESPSARRCLSRIFDGLGTNGRAVQHGARTVRTTVGNLRLAPLDVASATRGTDGGVGLSISVTVTYTLTQAGHSAIFPTTLYADELMFGVGRASVSLGSLGLNELFPAELEAHLFTQLIGRATSASHRYPAVTS